MEQYDLIIAGAGPAGSMLAGNGWPESGCFWWNSGTFTHR